MYISCFPEINITRDKTMPRKLMNTKNNCPRNGRRKKRRESYNVPLHRVLSQVWPDGSISATALLTLNSLLEDLFNRLAVQESQLTHVR